jgi:acetyl esterase/lipase
MLKRIRQIITWTIVSVVVCSIVAVVISDPIFGYLIKKQIMLLTGSLLKDVTYCTYDGVDSKMDIYFPIKTNENPSPVLIYVHGGAWITGNKDTTEGLNDISELLSRDYIIAVVNYRLAPNYKFPAQIEDVKCAVRYLRANAVKYGIDSENIGAWGDSSGGHLVALLALTNETDGFDIGQYTNYSSSIEVAVDYYGPTNITDPNFYNIYSLALQDIFGSYENMVNASPVKYVSKNSPPFLIFQGDKDMIVFQSQSEGLYEKLIENNVTAKLVIVKNANHGFISLGGSISPTRKEITTMVADFFDKYLKNENKVPIEIIKEVPYVLDYPEKKIYIQEMYKGIINENRLDSPVQELLKEGWKIEYKNIPQLNITMQRVTIN